LLRINRQVSNFKGRKDGKQEVELGMRHMLLKALSNGIRKAGINPIGFNLGRVVQ
jgi:hypothetical protein